MQNIEKEEAAFLSDWCRSSMTLSWSKWVSASMEIEVNSSSNQVNAHMAQLQRKGSELQETRPDMEDREVLGLGFPPNLPL